VSIGRRSGDGLQEENVLKAGGRCDAKDRVALRAVIADHDPLARRVIGDTLRRSGIAVVAETGSGYEAVELAVYHRPDVVVIDYRLPGIDGIEATRRLRAYDRSFRVVMLTAASEEDLGLRALAAGAVGFIGKDVELDALPRALHGVCDGQAAISRQLTLALIERYQTTSTDRHGMRPVRSGLTDREWQVLDLLAAGLTSDEVAATLVLSVETVRSHKKRLYRKLGVRSRDEAKLAAVRLRTVAGLDAGPLHATRAADTSTAPRSALPVTRDTHARDDGQDTGRSSTSSQGRAAA
jgi:NarL family two-component system response regulator LiaR